jgi:REP element-mobilizing transposase RayT
MRFPARPERLHGFPYDEPGPVFHCRIGCRDRIGYFAQAECAQMVVEALRFRHDQSAEILAFCVMPDHVHLLLSLRRHGQPLSRWVGDLKRWIVRRAMTELGRELAWQPNFFEHVLRDCEDVTTIARYILQNPVRLGLVARWQDYPWCGSLAWQLED